MADKHGYSPMPSLCRRILEEVEPNVDSTAENRKYEGTKTQSSTRRDFFVVAFVPLWL